MKEVRQDILLVEHGVIAHIVNLQGKMGGVMAKAIAQKWPIVLARYLHYFDPPDPRCKWALGKVQMVKVQSTLYICNMAAQEFYGPGDQQYLDSKALRQCLKKLNIWSKAHNLPIYLPFKMGANNAGGDWQEILQIIQQECSAATICIL